MKLHIGSACVYLTDGWINIDLPEAGAALQRDWPERVRKWGTTESDYYGRIQGVTLESLENGIKPDHGDLVCDRYGSWDYIPVDDGEATEILSRQCFEHLSLREAKLALMEARRVLCDGGILRLDVPDHEESLRQFKLAKDEKTAAFFLRHILGSRKNAAAYHIMGWTRKSMIAFLDEFGFDFVEEEPNIHFYPSFCLKFRKRHSEEMDKLFDETKPWDAAWQYAGPKLQGSIRSRRGGQLRINDEWKILEIGCGSAPLPGATMYVDIDPGSIENLPFEKQNHNHFRVCDIHELPQEWTGQFDFVYCSHIFEHLKDPVRAAAEISRVGKQGMVICPTPEKDALFCWHELDHKWKVFEAGKTGNLRMMPLDTAWRDRVHDEDISKSFHQIFRLEKRRFEPEGSQFRKWLKNNEADLDVIHIWRGKLRIDILD